MKRYIKKIIIKDFGNVSYARGLYNIIRLYERYVPEKERHKFRNTGRRMRY